MDKGIKIYITVISIVTIIAIIVGALIFMTGSMGRVFGGAKPISEEVAVEGEITALKVDIDAAQVSVEYGDAPSVSYVMPETSKPDIDIKDGTLSIVEPHGVKIGGFGFNAERHVKIVLPEGTKLDSMTLRVDAGNVDLEDLVTAKADIDVDAGNLDIDEIETERLKIKVDAGNVDIDGSTVDDLQIEIDAGNIDVEDSTVKGGSCKADVGNISLAGDIGNVTATTDIGWANIDND